MSAFPRTVNFLLHGMNAVEFRKLNKVGSNSQPNAFPMLFGKTTEAVVRIQMDLPTLKADLNYKQACKEYLDDKSYIPLEYMKAGYKCSGYMISYRTSASLVRFFLTNKSNRDKSFPKFSFTWFVNLAHDNTDDLYTADYDLYEFFVKNRFELNDAFIFFLGDHGPRFGSEAKTDFGQREANNPFLYVIVPETLREKQLHKQLQENSKQLVTHHDLHSTLKDILYFQTSSSFSDITFKKFNSNPRGSSLLRRFEDGVLRTCKTLPIPFHYCICQFRMVNVSDSNLTTTLGRIAAERLADELKLQGVSDICEEIALEKVIKAEKYALSGDITINTNPTTYGTYEVVFEVAPPAKGQFQARK
ncbi:hypothetical protein DICVIV_04321 [Dictyocaulus viviparus]|uniref:Arylsulfatase n=1 Tax=Dictyocaulus viviparus TaxID=29172 RepID=A0A0D8XXZ1_DICVI|nr:hypothetical protein DICVIV_04321 [Dictyocaulus viviparus]